MKLSLIALTLITSFSTYAVEVNRESISNAAKTCNLKFLMQADNALLEAALQGANVDLSLRTQIMYAENECVLKKMRNSVQDL